MTLPSAASPLDRRVAEIAGAPGQPPEAKGSALSPLDRKVAELVKRAARPLGVERFGFCTLEGLSRLLECRGKRLLPEKGSVILLLLPYYAGEFPERNVARYALCDDYHTIAGEILQEVIRPLSDAFPGEMFIPFADSSPIPEVEAGALSGLGFIGRNGQLITPWYGSLTFLCEIVTTLPLTATGPGEGSCGDCRRCLDRCPTGALGFDGLDVGRCRSHISQKKGALSEEERRQLSRGGLAWGCDLCTDACPHNQSPALTTVPRLREGLEPLLTTENLPELIKRKSYGWRGAAVLRRNLAILEEKEKSPFGG